VRALKPEFLDRLDEIVLFDALGADELAKIVDINLSRLNARLAERRIGVEVTQAARDRLPDRVRSRRRCSYGRRGSWQ